MIAYHFISEKFALDVISNQRLKLSLINDLNDPFELISAYLPDTKSSEEVMRLKNQMASVFGVLCFSKNWNDPLLWSHYANKHKGVALKFWVNDTIALPITYSKDRFKVDFEEIERLKPELTWKEAEGLWFTKFKSWEYEEEIRVICKQSACIKENGLLFDHLSNTSVFLLEIIFGSLCKISVEEIKEKLPAGKQIIVTKSRLSHHEFNIVEDEGFQKKLLINEGNNVKIIPLSKIKKNSIETLK
jgi:hypothetical protein